MFGASCYDCIGASCYKCNDTRASELCDDNDRKNHIYLTTTCERFISLVKPGVLVYNQCCKCQQRQTKFTKISEGRVTFLSTYHLGICLDGNLAIFYGTTPFEELINIA